MTSAWEILVEKRAELAPGLRREFWLPLRRLLKMFHVLPIAAAAAVFGLLAFDGQLTEIYISYMEEVTSGGPVVTVVRFAAAAVGFGLISALLYEAHYRLSGPRINVIYSMNAEVGTGSKLRHVQDVSAIVVALAPWVGLVGGLFNAKTSLVTLFEKLKSAKIDPATLQQLQHVPVPSDWAIVAAVIILGLVMALLAAINPKNRTLQRSVMVLSPPATALIFLLLIGMPEFTATTFNLGALALTIAAVVIYYIVYYRIEMMRAYIFRAQALLDDDNFSLRQWQRIILFGWALLPWLAVLAFYFFLFPRVGVIEKWLSGPPASAEQTALPSLAMVPVAMCWVIAVGLVVASILHELRDRMTPRIWLYGVICALAVIGLLVFWRATPAQIVTIYRMVGPLGSLAFSLLFLISIFVLLAVLSQRSGFPALTLSIFVIVVSAILPLSPMWSTALMSLLCLIIAVAAVLSRLLPTAAVAILLIAIVLVNFFKSNGSPIPLYPAAHGPDLAQQFDDWLTSRGVPKADGTRPSALTDSCFATPTDITAHGAQYPVFIIAVEGGGIYAASAASMFLARLQDENPCFSDHVFAISAVSGGAIGASVFQAIESARLNKATAEGTAPATLTKAANSAGGPASAARLPSSGCKPPPDLNDPTASFALEQEVCEIVQGDHFSPLIASIFPELLGFSNKGRPVELAASFQQSTRMEDAGAGPVLSAPFTSDWSYSSKSPALVLNATWVETGFRAAFAPFPLHAIDDSLYSFLDQNMPENLDETLIQAAVVSARFPFVLPPYSVEVMPPPAAKQTGRSASAASKDPPVHWNFVDGGYADSSGAATALALYKALSSAARTRNVVLRLILLTSSDPTLEPNQIDGTTFADVMGPIDAMLNVRAGLTNEAVARACDGVVPPSANVGSAARPQNTCQDRANEPNSPLQIVGIEDETYGLSLGWKISQTTFSVVSWMLGEPGLVSAADCNRAAATPEANSQSNGKFILNDQVVKRNSCVLWSVEQALGTPTGGAAVK